MCDKTLVWFIASNDCPKCPKFEVCMNRLDWFGKLWMSVGKGSL